jgi:cell division protein FtsI (penicillin-binding protein 3)
MMIKVVEHKHGTGTNALVPGVKVGGKTGTAQKARLVGRGYESGKYISSFVGFIEADTLGISEKLTFVVSVDEPRAKGYYGGVVAAPIFQRAMVRILNTLAIRRALKTNDESGPGAKGRKFDSREDVTDTRPEVAIETTTLKRSL